VRVAGEALLERTVRLAAEAGTDPVVVVLGANWECIARAVDLSQTQVVVNPEWEWGIASSIRAGMEALLGFRSDADAAMILVCDQPRLTVDHLRELVRRFEQAEGRSIAASRYAGIAGIPAIFPGSQFAQLMALEGDAGARYLLREPDCPITAVDFAGGEADIDTPEDLARAGAEEENRDRG
jgi:CTP:molybdopterin cytidylyltransferase MocA